MKHKTFNKEECRGATKSSVSLSGKIVCEDEVCIGKEVTAGEPWPSNQVQPEKEEKKSTDTRMFIGGKEVCSEDACIGRK